MSKKVVSKKDVNWVGSGQASIVSHTKPNGSNQSDQAMRALVHKASSLEVQHYLGSDHSTPGKTSALS